MGRGMRKDRKNKAAHSRRVKGVTRGMPSSVQPFHMALQILYISYLNKGPHCAGQQKIPVRGCFWSSGLCSIKPLRFSSPG